MIRKLLKNLLGENFTENNAKLATVNFAIILLMFLLSGIMLFFLPEQISILHTGDTYYPLPSVLAVWLLPIIALVINIGFIKQKRLSKMNSVCCSFSNHDGILYFTDISRMNYEAHTL